jgi:subtilisin family serine protease
MEPRAGEPSNHIEVIQDDVWMQEEPGPRLEQYSRLDPALRSVVALIARQDWDQVYRRTGVRRDLLQSNEPQYLPLLVEYDWKDIKTVRKAREWLQAFKLEAPEAFFPTGEKEQDRPPPRYATARIAVRSDDPSLLFLKSEERIELREQITRILNDKKGYVVRLELPGAAQAFNAEALGDIGLTPGNRQQPGIGPRLDGTGVVIGIIDDGCAFAHPNFLRDIAAAPGLESRLLCLWDQGRSSAPGPWKAVSGYVFQGYEVTKGDIDFALGQPGLVNSRVVDEDRVYRFLSHEIADLASHGTHVMDIAAGNGRAPMSTEGTAPNADIIFVQLPAASIASGGVTLHAAIFEGIDYIFQRAGNRPVVINVSYGGYAGPHDGTSIVEQKIDLELAARRNRAVVVSAGNGFEADCHAAGTLPFRGNTRRNLKWIIKPEDPTDNMLEIWYSAGKVLQLSLTSPTGQTIGPAAGLGLGAGPQLLQSQGKLLGTFDHQQAVAPNGLNRIEIRIHPTGSVGSPSTTPLAPPGVWQVHLDVVQGPVKYHAWIERDTAGRPGGARRMQSHFDPADAESRGTLASYATGRRSISVGAYNSATQEVCRYSACGPTRDGRQKPDVLAPAEEDAAGRGILCASARSALPSRMNGTSASAPQVAGLVALLLQAAAAKGKTLSATQIQTYVRSGAKNAYQPVNPPRPLRPNAHVEADKWRRVKQSDPKVWKELIGNGRLNWPASITQV